MRAPQKPTVNQDCDDHWLLVAQPMIKQPMVFAIRRPRAGSLADWNAHRNNDAMIAPNEIFKTKLEVMGWASCVVTEGV